MELNKTYCEPNLETMKRMEDNSIDCVITSPPYWGLRDYGTEGQLGLEKTVTEYLEKLWTIFDEVYRVLKKGGTCWVNLGDTYSTNSGGMGKTDKSRPKGGQPKFSKQANETLDFIQNKNSGLPDKCLCQIPSRFSIGITDRGWILRNQIIWHKKSCMPSSTRDRFTVDFEFVYFFVKSRRYYFEQQFEKANYDGRKKTFKNTDIKENPDNPFHTLAHERWKTNPTKYKDTDYGGNGNGFQGHSGYSKLNHPFVRNKRCVWSDISPEPTSEKHFATFPQALIEPMLRAGCPEFVCKKCGQPREKIYKSENRPNKEKSNANVKTNNDDTGKINRNNFSGDLREVEFFGLTDCLCGEGFEPGIVYDPFMGSGTTALVAKKLGRNFLGSEINPEYITISEKRLSEELHFKEVI